MNAKDTITDTTSKVYAHVVLDRSGSMSANAEEAVQGYHAYVDKLSPGSRVSLTLFDSEGVDLVREAVEPVAAKLKAGEYEPRARTPLYDAIGRSVRDAEARAKDFDRVALVIITDGYENASTEFTREQILKLLKKKQDKDGWLVIYLGANQDASAVSAQFGVRGANAMSIDTQNINDSMLSAARATDVYSSSLSADIGLERSAFTDAERASARRRRH